MREYRGIKTQVLCDWTYIGYAVNRDTGIIPPLGGKPLNQ